MAGVGQRRNSHTGIRSAECRARSESLYRLSYPDPLNLLVRKVTTGLQRVNAATVLSRSVSLKRIYVSPFAAVNRMNVKSVM